jgi:DNA-binding transcriptional regulator YiaG
MSDRLSLKEALARRVSVAAEPRHRSGSPVALVLRMDSGTGLPRPVDVVRLLERNGLSLRKAHDVLNRLARSETVPVELPAVAVPDTLDADLQALGIRGTRRAAPQPVDIAALRHALGLTQREFAIRYAIELGTLRNWEQNRSPQDPQTRILLHVIERHPEMVEAVLDELAAGA